MGSDNLKNIPLNILDTINNTINHYDIFSNHTAYVAFSGGKDSSFLCHALKELDYEVIGITTDIGYNANWNALKRIAKELAVETVLLDLPYSEFNFPKAYKEAFSFFEDVKTLSNIPVSHKTICTPCYNAKISILRCWAEANGINQIAFGHHGTDAIASLLKSYFYYFDFKCRNHTNFENTVFKELVVSQAENFIDTTKVQEWHLFTDTLTKLVYERIVGTDEPPRKYIENSNIEIVRPLFNIYESDILSFFKNQNIEFQKSECVISKYRNTKDLTPREMMHQFITNKLNIERLNDLHNIVKCCIDQNGFLIYNVRNNRDKILGTYKCNENKK